MAAENPQPILSPDEVISDSFRVQSLIGRGGFSEIYKVHDISSPSSVYALKIGAKSGKSVISNEAKFLQMLNGSPMFPRIRLHGEVDGSGFIIMELLGHSLSKMRSLCPLRKFPIHLAFKTGIHMLKCIEQLHRRGYIHRDIKPANFLMRRDPIYPICLIDLGLARAYADQFTGVHLPQKSECNFAGTLAYASDNAINGLDSSRRDDVISWYYSLLELSTGTLPWANCGTKEEVLRMRKSALMKKVRKELPKEVRTVEKKVFGLDFEAMPDYRGIMELLDESIRRVEPESQDSLDVELWKEEEHSASLLYSLKKNESFSNLIESTLSERQSLDLPKADVGCNACIVS